MTGGIADERITQFGDHHLGLNSRVISGQVTVHPEHLTLDQSTSATLLQSQIEEHEQKRK